MLPEKLKNAPKWCVSKNKMPLDMHALAKGLEWGASDKRSHSCYAGFDQAKRMSKAQNLPMTLYLETADVGYYIIDIEKECPARIRQGILLALHDHIEYLERSLSGKGFHLAVNMGNTDDLSVAKYKKWFEVLARHHCTFTFDEIGFPDAYYADIAENQSVGLWDEDINPDDLEAKRDHELLQALSAPLTPRAFYDIIGAGKSGIIGQAQDIGDFKKCLSTFGGEHADLFNSLCDLEYQKTVDDFHGDLSRWEFGYASKLHYHLQRISMDMIDARMNHYQIDLTQEQAVMLVYMTLKQCLPPREKHKTIRNGLPWLLYTSQQVYIKTWDHPPGQDKPG